MDLIIELKPAEKPGKAQTTVNKSSPKAFCSGATQDHTILSAYHSSTGPVHSGKIITCISQVGHRAPEPRGKYVALRGHLRPLLLSRACHSQASPALCVCELRFHWQHPGEQLWNCRSAVSFSRSLFCHLDNGRVPLEMGYVSGSPLVLSSYSVSSGNNGF